MKKLSFLFVFLISVTNIYSQNVTYNYLVDSTGTDIRQVMRLFENYIHSNPEKNADNPYWNEDEKSGHKNFDFLEKEFQPTLYMGFPVHVLSIKSREGLYEIKTQFSYCKEDGSPYILAIVNYYARKFGAGYRLINALTINKKEWVHEKAGIIDYYFPAYHEFDKDNAKAMNTFINEICKNFKVEPKPFEYYLADTYDEIQRLKGIDYYMGMGGEAKPSGKSTDDKVYCAGLGENYFHEVVHLLIDHKYPNKHFWISEGIATYLGGSRGKSLNWHLERTNKYLNEHTETDLNNMLKLTNIDQYTSYHYVIGGLIVKKIIEKGGWDLLIEFMKTGAKDEDYYKAIDDFLGVKQEELNKYIRNEIAKELEKE